MANLHDIESEIIRAISLEKTNPAGAHALYERVERKMDDHLGMMGFTREEVFCGASSMCCYFSDLYKVVMQGYARLQATNL